MSSISGVSSVSSSYASMKRPDSAKMASDLFARLDTKGQGYIEKSDLQSALNAVSASGKTDAGAAPSADDLFSALDSNSDGKVTKSELTDSMKSLADSLDSQAMSSRMGMGGAGGMRGAPPEGMPPHHGGGQGGPDDAGMTKDQMTSMASDVASTDSALSSSLSNVASNFDKADTDGDGKVSFKEAMAYEQSTKESSASSDGASTSGTTSSASSSTSSTQDTQARMMHQLMQLIHAYADPGKDSQSAGLSAVA